MKKDHLAEKEYRYGCSIDCGGTPLRVYARELDSQGNWSSYEDYLSAPTFVWYNNSDGSSSDYAWLPGHQLSEQGPPGDGSRQYVCCSELRLSRSATTQGSHVLESA